MSSAHVNETDIGNIDDNNKEYEDGKDTALEEGAGENEKKEGEKKVDEEETVHEGEYTTEEEDKIVELEEKIEGEEKVEIEEEKDVETVVEREEGKEGQTPQEENVGDEQEVEGEQKIEVTDEEHKEVGEYGELEGEVPEEQEEEEKKEEDKIEEEIIEEEPEYVEEPVDPAAPLNLTDSKEALRSDFQIRPDQLAQVEKLWALYQDYTPAYSDIDGYITIKELVYMLKCLFLMTYTEEQLMELVDFCVRPKDERGYITYEQFLHMVKIRWRDMEICDELRSALQNYDPEKTGEVQAEELREVLGKLGNKLSPKVIEEFIKEIDISGEGKIGIEDVVAIVGMDMMQDEIAGPKADDEDEF